jgi:hypothetical protein
MSVEEVIADDKRGPTPTLLVIRLRVEGQRNEVPLPRDILRHLPDLTADGMPPIEFFRLVVLGDAPDELPQVMSASNSADRSHHEGAVPHRHVHLIPDVDVDIQEQRLAQANTLAVAPFLNLRDHHSTPEDIHSIALGRWRGADSAVLSIESFRAPLLASALDEGTTALG